MINFRLEIRQAARSLMRGRAFTGTASLTLALGFGAAITALNLRNKLADAPLAGIRDQDQMMVVRTVLPSTGRSFIPNYVARERVQEMLERLGSVGQIAGYGTREIGVSLPGQRTRILKSQSVSPNYFDVLGVAPLLGSLAPPSELSSGKDAVVISENLWAGLFDRRPDALGATILINGAPTTVIGVAAAGFRGTERLSSSDLWFPVRQSFSQLIVRLDSGTRVWQAAGMARAILGERVPIFVGLGVSVENRAIVERFLSVSTVGSLLVLLIACANVANLLLFRGLTRQSETAVHRALGASAQSLIRRHVTEAMLLAVPALAVGIPVAYALTSVLAKVRLTRFSEPFGAMPMGWSQVGLAIVGALVVATAAGILPAIIAARTEPLQGVQGMGHGRAGQRLRHIFATSQVSLSMSLVVLMFLVVGTLVRLRSIDLGFKPAGAMTLRQNPGDAGYQPEEANDYFRTLMARFREAPEFDAVAIGKYAPLVDGQTVYGIGTTATSDTLRIRVNHVSSGYFDVMGLRFVAGRGFTAAEATRDSAAMLPIVIGQTVSEMLFGNRPAVGEMVWMRTRPHVVVGVVSDSRWDHVEPVGGWVEDPRLLVYDPFDEAGWWYPTVYPRAPRPGCAGNPGCAATIFVRPRVAPEAARAAIRRIAAEADPRLPAYEVTSLQEIVDLSIIDRIVLARMMTLLSLFATGLAAVGIYGMVSYTVASRRRDLGIRIALGARSGTVAAHVLREVVLVGGVGTAVGLAGAAALSRLIASQLYGVAALDATTYLLAGLTLAAVTVAAAGPAILSAIRVDPITVLRSD